MTNIAILLSGRGSNFIAIKEAIDSGVITTAQISCVIGNKFVAQGLSTAQNFGINTFFIDPATHKDDNGKLNRKAYDTDILKILKSRNVDLICLAGYMMVVSDVLVDEYYGRMINIHPSLLPAFPGLNAQKQALDYGVRVSGCTVHFVDKGVDTGPIIMQATVPVYGDDNEYTLSQRILKEEHCIYTKAVALYTGGYLKIDGRIVKIVGGENA
jgi:phosphoribosylglycinamide formyltransferase-1